MDAKRILRYLRDLSANNNRDWFQEHKQEYNVCRQNFEEGVTQAVATIAQFDASISHITPKDACIVSIVIRVSVKISALIKTILVLISVRMARNRCVEAIISICNRASVCSALVAIGCLPTS